MVAKDLVLVTGGVGYIGSHTIIELIEVGYDVVIIDNLVNAHEGCLKRVEELVKKKLTFYKVDLLNKEEIDGVFQKHPTIKHVIHFAALKAVGESVTMPLTYYKNNIIGTINLLEVMSQRNVKNIIFSSSATVYGTPQYLPLDENHPVGGCTNPYGKTKLYIEEMLTDLHVSDPSWQVIILRYFNPVGSHKSGQIGEDPSGVPNNLMPFVGQVAVGRRPEVKVFGNDYDTPDGTGVRDYIHVVDLACGHVVAINKLDEKVGCKVYNLGTGRGYSVLEMIAAMEKACGHKIPYSVEKRRFGDLASVYADTKLAEKELGWSAKRSLDEMCQDLWRWQSQNVNGFQTDKA